MVSGEHTPIAGADIRASLLVTADELAAAPRRGLVLVDCRFDLSAPEAGYAAFRAGHIPGARYAHLDRDLAGPTGPATGRHPLPSAAAFAATCTRLGIGPGISVIAYDAGNGAFAARLWWLLRYFGHAEARLLDGGLAAWQAAGLGLASGDDAGSPAVPPFVAGAPLERTVAAVELLGDSAPLLIDVRGAERFGGTSEPIDPVAGHVPGAINLPFTRSVGPDQRFRSAAELATLFAASLGEGRPLAVMCGSGVTACHGLFALALAGRPGAALYPGSWSEWIRDPGRPVARDS